MGVASHLREGNCWLVLCERARNDDCGGDEFPLQGNDDDRFGFSSSSKRTRPGNNLTVKLCRQEKLREGLVMAEIFRTCRGRLRNYVELLERTE